MIKHIVMFKFQKEAIGKSKEENIKEAQRLLKDLETAIPSLKKLEVRTNTKTAPDSNYDIALICDFNDMESLNAYQNHPEHIKFGAFISQVKEARACIDYEY